MSQFIINNRKWQEDEILVFSNIYNYNEFSYSKEDIIEYYYNIFPNIDEGEVLLKFKNIYEDDFHSFSNYFIKYLPPIRIYLQLMII